MTIQRLSVALLCAAMLAPMCRVVDAQETVHDRLTTLAQEMFDTSLRRHPMDATTLGETKYDADLETPSRAYRNEDLALLRKWQARLATIAPPTAKLSLVDRDDARLLQARLAQQINGLTVYRTDEKDYSGPAQAILNAIFVQFLHLPIEAQGATRADVLRAWSDITGRLEKAPGYIVAGEALVTSPGHLFGVTGDEQLAGAPDFFKGALTDAAKAQLPHACSRVLKRRATRRSPRSSRRAHTSRRTPRRGLKTTPLAGRRMTECCMIEQLLPYNAADVEDFAAAELAGGWAAEAWLHPSRGARHALWP